MPIFWDKSLYYKLPKFPSQVIHYNIHSKAHSLTQTINEKQNKGYIIRSREINLSQIQRGLRASWGRERGGKRNGNRN